MKNIAEGNWFFDEIRKYSDPVKPYKDIMSSVTYEKKITNGYAAYEYKAEYIENFKQDDLYRSKHFLQMTEKEKKFLFDKLQKIIQSDYMILSHLNEAIQKRNIYEKTRKDLLVLPQIVECRLMHSIYGKYTDVRITIRSTTTPSKKWIYFGVISLLNKRFITIYQKDIEEFMNNNNAQNKKYDENLDLIKLITQIENEEKLKVNNKNGAVSK